MAKIVKPTSAEQKIIDRRLMKQYPQMYEPGWGNVRLMAKFIKAKKKKMSNLKKYSTRDEVIEARLKHAGLTEAEISKLRRKK